MPWTEQEKQEVKAARREMRVRRIAARHQRNDGGPLGQGSGDPAYVPARRPGEGWE